jgi:hypothetical protein
VEYLPDGKELLKIPLNQDSKPLLRDGDTLNEG